METCFISYLYYNLAYLYNLINFIQKGIMLNVVLL